jgi:hypothetical protein
LAARFSDSGNECHRTEPYRETARRRFNISIQSTAANVLDSYNVPVDHERRDIDLAYDC